MVSFQAANHFGQHINTLSNSQINGALQVSLLALEEALACRFIQYCTANWGIFLNSLNMPLNYYLSQA
jgi:hypothetical protein